MFDEVITYVKSSQVNRIDVRGSLRRPIASLFRPVWFTRIVDVREVSDAAIVKTLANLAPVVGSSIGTDDRHPSVILAAVDA